MAACIWLSSFNRTIVELKHVLVVIVPCAEVSFNRTIVELKLVKAGSRKHTTHRF